MARADVFLTRERSGDHEDQHVRASPTMCGIRKGSYGLGYTDLTVGLPLLERAVVDNALKPQQHA